MTQLGRVESAEDGLWIVPRKREDGVTILAAIRQAGVGAHRADGRVVVPRGQIVSFVQRLNADPMFDWSAEARLYGGNVVAAARGSDAVRRVLLALADDNVVVAAAMLEDVTLLPGLDDHQIVNVAAMTAAEGHGLALFDEQGAGKTVSLIAAFDVLAQRDEADLLLIFAPKSMIAEWKNDFDRFTGGLYRVAVVSGSGKERREQLRQRADVIVTNFEAAVNGADDLARVVGKHGRRAVLAVDESFHVKNADTRRSRAVAKLRRSMGRTFVLCGTPAPNSPADIVAQMSLIDFGLTFDDVEIPDDRDKARDVVGNVLHRRRGHLRHLKANVLDLPSRTFDRLIVPMAPRQAALYVQTVAELRDDARSASDSDFERERMSYMSRRSTLLRLASHPGGVCPGYDEVPGKILAIDKILEQLPSEEKVVIWSFYTASLDRLAERYAGYGVARYDGTVTDITERRELVRRFQEDDETRIFVGNPAAAGAGLTLHRAATAVYESMSNQAAHYLQSLDRIHRRGQVREVRYLLLACRDTIEPAMYDRLLDKQSSARKLLADVDPPPMTRELFLADLADVPAPQVASGEAD